eukprot:gnl/MRDRNA2_/MRDRNA2_72529_c0_seq1.p2 gnl/MRDRNA2_/MRDRNA2_72529_c0~~gnl/MRDRNA2_/MRDRNA2_72529_c0_seq1.p2  ORF type:complete len:121 (+),score=22.09 gnl/MRDRNA2_/MRDRNA2_72529_c0_seq1:466-828(+)
MGLTEEMVAQNPESIDSFITETFKYFDLDGDKKISFDEYLVINAVNRFTAKMQPEVVVQFVPVPVEMDPASMSQEERRQSIQLPGRVHTLQNDNLGPIGNGDIQVQGSDKPATSGLFPCC